MDLWGKPPLVSSDVSAILDSGPPNKHFPSSLLPFELAVGSLPNRWLAVWEPGAGSFCVFVSIPKLSEGKQQLIFSVICDYMRE